MNTEQIQKLEKDLKEMQTVLAALRQEPELNVQEITANEKDIDFLQDKITKFKDQPQKSFKYKQPVAAKEEPAEAEAVDVSDIEVQISSVNAFVDCLKKDLNSDDPERNLPWIENEIKMQQAILQSLIGVRFFVHGAPNFYKLMYDIVAGMERPFTLSNHIEFVKMFRRNIDLKHGVLETKLVVMLEGIEQNLTVAQWVGQAAADALMERPGNKAGEKTAEQTLYESAKRALNFIDEVDVESIEDGQIKRQLGSDLRNALDLYEQVYETEPTHEQPEPAN